MYSHPYNSYRNNVREEVIPEDMVHDVNVKREELIGKYSIFLGGLPAP